MALLTTIVAAINTPLLDTEAGWWIKELEKFHQFPSGLTIRTSQEAPGGDLQTHGRCCQCYRPRVWQRSSSPFNDLADWARMRRLRKAGCHPGHVGSCEDWRFRICIVALRSEVRFWGFAVRVFAPGSRV